MKNYYPEVLFSIYATAFVVLVLLNAGMLIYGGM
tara:strand:+ start:3600 stop:3701 length:102 start_codon:yes stop_codon:yes gene_type:complete